jgi:hypothetical protein
MIYFLIISWDYFEFVVGQPMMTSQYQSQVIKYNQFFLQADQPIRVQFSTVEQHYTRQIEGLQQRLQAVESERNLMMV